MKMSRLIIGAGLAALGWVSCCTVTNADPVRWLR